MGVNTLMTVLLSRKKLQGSRQSSQKMLAVIEECTEYLGKYKEALSLRLIGMGLKKEDQEQYFKGQVGGLTLQPC